MKRFLIKVFGVGADFWVVVLIFLVFSFLYSLLSVTRHNHFQSQGIDFSIYDQALWLYSRIQIPFSTINNNLDLADRFRPIMIPLSALFWFTQNERVLLLFQAIIVSAAVFPVWLLARRLVPRILAIVIAFLYIDNIGVQSAMAYDFHEMSLLPFFLAFLFYFLEREKWRSFFTTLIICLSVREHVGFLLSVFGLYIWLTKKKVKIAIATSLIAFLWSAVSIKFLMPFFGQSHYYQLGGNTTLSGVILNYLTRPDLAIKDFFTPWEKSLTLFWSIFSFGLLPLGYLAALPIIFLQFASRFLDQAHPIRWTLYYHYSLELAVILAVSTIYSACNILKKFGRSGFVLPAILVLLMTLHVFANVILPSPLKNLLKKPFYLTEGWSGNTLKLLSLVPDNSAVAAQNNLVPHLSHRKYIYLLPKTGDAEYILMDLHPGQNNWNFYNGDLAAARLQFKELILTKRYKIMASSGDVYLLKSNLSN